MAADTETTTSVAHRAEPTRAAGKPAGRATGLSYRFWRIKQNVHQKYRADIDGLRAVAILSVLVYHGFPRWSQGGFVGVDIFFVISGFLISGIILEGLERGTFSYVDFYIRRIKRIFPPLILIFTAVLLAGWLFLFEDEYRLLGKHIAAGVAFLSNFVLLREGGYFDVAAELKPLLHLWSLAIEEQFYLVWPLLLIWASKRASAIRLIVFMAIMSFAANIWLVESRPAHAFYVSFPRFWELMLGSSLAYADHARRRQAGSAGTVKQWVSGRMASAGMRNLSAAAGAVLILASIFGLDTKMPFPGWWALVPTVGTFLIIAAGSGAWLNRVVLSNEAMVSIGLISYPLYLWHWPALYFARVVSNGEPGIALRSLVIAVAFVGAIISFQYVEYPIRTRHGGGVAVVLCAIMIVIGGIGLMGFKSWIPTRPPQVWQDIAWARYDRNAPRSWDDSHRLKPYYIGDPSRAGILFFGDSHMETYYPRVEQLMRTRQPLEKGVAFVTAGGCPPLPMVDRVDSAQPVGCSDFFAQALQYAKKGKFRKIVLCGYWDGYFIGLQHGATKGPVLYTDGDAARTPIAPGSAEFKRVFTSLQLALSELRAGGAEVYIVLANPSAPLFDPTRILAQFDRVSLSPQPPPRAAFLKRAAWESRVAPVNAALRKLGDSLGASIIDPTPSLCRESECSNMKNGRPIFTDDNHLTGWYARYYATYIDQVFDYPRVR